MANFNESLSSYLYQIDNLLNLLEGELSNINFELSSPLQTSVDSYNEECGIFGYPYPTRSTSLPTAPVPLPTRRKRKSNSNERPRTPSPTTRQPCYEPSCSAGGNVYVNAKTREGDATATANFGSHYYPSQPPYQPHNYPGGYSGGNVDVKAKTRKGNAEATFDNRYPYATRSTRTQATNQPVHTPPEECIPTLPTAPVPLPTRSKVCKRKCNSNERPQSPSPPPRQPCYEPPCSPGGNVDVNAKTKEGHATATANVGSPYYPSQPPYQPPNYPGGYPTYPEGNVGVNAETRKGNATATFDSRYPYPTRSIRTQATIRPLSSPGTAPANAGYPCPTSSSISLTRSVSQNFSPPSSSASNPEIQKCYQDIQETLQNMDTCLDNILVKLS